MQLIDASYRRSSGFYERENTSLVSSIKYTFKCKDLKSTIFFHEICWGLWAIDSLSAPKCGLGQWLGHTMRTDDSIAKQPLQQRLQGHGQKRQPRKEYLEKEIGDNA